MISGGGAIVAASETHLGISEQAVANHKSFVLRKLKDAASRSRPGQLDLADFGLEDHADDDD